MGALPRIKHIWIEGNNAFLKVENLNGFMRVLGGNAPGSFTAISESIDKSNAL